MFCNGKTIKKQNNCDSKTFKNSVFLARNGFAKIGFYVVFCRSDYLNMIGFQSDLQKNRIWADSLNEAFNKNNSLMRGKTFTSVYLSIDLADTGSCGGVVCECLVCGVCVCKRGRNCSAHKGSGRILSGKICTFA